MHHTASYRTIFTRAAAGVCALALCGALGACGSDSGSGAEAGSSASASNSATGLTEMKGITATGKPGEKPTVKFSAPMDVPDNGYAILQEGDGETMKDGDRLCAQGISLNAKTGEEITDTWSSGKADCSIVLTSDSTKMDAEIFRLLQGKKLNTTLALGSNDGNDSGNSYINVFTFIAQSKDLTKAEGKKVSDVPSDLPKVTTAEDGKPSIDMHGYKGSDKLVAQTLIEGAGAKLTESDTAVVKYTGWLLDGTQFDSSWDRGSTFDASLSGGVIQGWIQGLKGKTVGSQVLLVVPPDLGYGDTATGSIPANSTLVFVVDILAKY